MDFEFKPRGSSKYVEKRFPREKTLMRRKNKEVLDRKQRKYRDQKAFAVITVAFIDGVDDLSKEIYEDAIQQEKWDNEPQYEDDEEFCYECGFFVSDHLCYY